MKAVTVTLWHYDRRTGQWHAGRSHRSQSPVRARQWAEPRLGVFVGSSYEIRRGRRDFAEIKPRRAGKRVTTIEQPCREVPSCGDLGWW